MICRTIISISVKDARKNVKLNRIRNIYPSVLKTNTKLQTNQSQIDFSIIFFSRIYHLKIYRKKKRKAIISIYTERTSKSFIDESNERECQLLYNERQVYCFQFLYICHS